MGLAARVRFGYEKTRPEPDSLPFLLAMIGKYQNVRINVGVMEDLGVYSQNLNKVEDKLTFQISRMNPTEVKFEVGRVDNTVDRKINKGGLKGVLEMKKINLRVLVGRLKGTRRQWKSLRKAQYRGVGLDFTWDQEIRMGWSP